MQRDQHPHVMLSERCEWRIAEYLWQGMAWRAQNILIGKTRVLGRARKFAERDYVPWHDPVDRERYKHLPWHSCDVGLFRKTIQNIIFRVRY